MAQRVDNRIQYTSKKTFRIIFKRPVFISRGFPCMVANLTFELFHNTENNMKCAHYLELNFHTGRLNDSPRLSAT